MSLIKCPACGKDISEKAVACPTCGHPMAPPKSIAVDPDNGKRKGCLLAVLIIIAIVVIGSMAGNDHGSSTPAASPCRSDWTKCVDNADLVNNYQDWIRVQVECKSAANKQARYGTPEWPWMSFGSFIKGVDYIQKGTAVAVEPDAQFQNGFGAMVHSRVMCFYDLKSKQVLNVIITAR